MTKHASIRAALAALTLVAATGVAQADGFAGASLGGPHWDSSINGLKGRNTGVAGKIFGGYDFNEYVGVEGGGMWFGHRREDGERASGAGGYVDAVGRLPLADKVSLIGRAGVAYARFSSNGHDSAGGLKAGAGLQYAASDKLALRAEYEYYHFPSAYDSKVNVGQITAGLKYTF